MKQPASTVDKFKGSLLGCAVGDAMGAPLEGLSRRDIRKRYGEVRDFVDQRFGAGRITDDTQMTVALAQSIIEIGGFKQKHAAEKFGTWMKLSDEGVKEARGVEKACATACRALYRGAPPDESGVDSDGCGAAMRASPVGLRFYHDPKKLQLAAVSQARLTHTDPAAIAASVVVANAVAMGINDYGELDSPLMLGELASSTGRLSADTSRKIEGLKDYLEEDPETGFAYTKTSGHATEAVCAALFAFLNSPYDLERSLVTAVGAGGKTDSLGAMTGAISGAFNGVGAICPRWLEGIEGREYIEGLAFRLFTITPAFLENEYLA